MATLGPVRPGIVDVIRKCCEDEQRNPPVPRKYGDLPVSFEAITAEWLTATLGREYPGTSVEDFKLGPKDDGSYNRRHISIVWKGPAADKLPQAVFCKAAHSLENRIVLSHGGTYSEITFYKEIRPNLDIEAPIAYFAGYDAVSWVSLTMLKDLGKDAIFCTHDTKLSKDQFAQQVQILARLHGRFYRSQEPAFKKLLVHSERFTKLNATLDLETVCGNGFRGAKSVIPPRLFKREVEVWPCTLKSLERNESLPQTIVHCDVHLGMSS